MSTIKLITYLNWILIVLYGSSVVWAFLQANNPSHEMPGAEWIIKIVGFLLLLAMIGLNVAPYLWTKITALALVSLLLLVLRWFAD
ncbi:hypothetical protein LZD49_19975 [Dyadobacter sp. CY261]|uniref:hypothetical protein n=1 Tax=Dyadobacter sp. CY261 TaxID=2907203 RepID=UPI001F43D17C|nr:hypothetical protein [Dyadobacter sp. CY261]MCF0072769.1 hypothetical protein [Dyadobacter sp. CY261]